MQIFYPRRLKFENAMVKRESQRQKTENCKLTMKMTEIKNEMNKDGAEGARSGTAFDAPPLKKQKIVVEQMPEDWKIKCYTESPKASTEESLR